MEYLPNSSPEIQLAVVRRVGSQFVVETLPIIGWRLSLGDKVQPVLGAPLPAGDDYEKGLVDRVSNQTWCLEFGVSYSLFEHWVDQARVKLERRNGSIQGALDVSHETQD